MLTSLDNLFTRFKDEVGDQRVSKLQFIKNLNDLLLSMTITKPAEQTAEIYYVEGFHKYAKPDDMRDVIAIYSENAKIIRYVSNLRFKLKEPLIAFTDKTDNAVRFLKVRAPFTNSKAIVATECDSLTADGAWVASGGASNLRIDTNTKKSGGGSIAFDISGSQGVLTFTRTNAIDASSFTEHMRERFYTWLPTLPSNIVVRVGNDSSNYFEHTLTLQASKEKLTTAGNNEMEFAEDAATENGSVDKSNMVWFQFEFNFSVAIADTHFRLDKMVLASPEMLEFEYYTNYVGIGTDGSLKEKITEDEGTDDEPIIAEYPDFVGAVINGLCAQHLFNKAPERSDRYRSKYMADRRGDVLIGGIEFLLKKYPSRRASYKRVKTLPNLNGGRIKRRRFV